jgi:hypothetical protein
VDLTVHIQARRIGGELTCNVDTLILLCRSLAAPSLERLRIKLDVGAQHVVFTESFTKPLLGSHFPSLELLSFGYEDGVERIYNCRSFRLAFQDYDARRVISFTQTPFEQQEGEWKLVGPNLYCC